MYLQYICMYVCVYVCMCVYKEICNRGYDLPFFILCEEYSLYLATTTVGRWVVGCPVSYNWASKAIPTLGCSIEILRDMYIYVGMSVVS